MKLDIPPDRQQNKIAFKFIEKIIFDGKKRRLLDVGSADNLLKRFFSKNIRYYSLDIDKKEGKHDFVLDLDKEKIPVKNNFFDIILCLEVLEHNSYPSLVLKELKRVTRKKGIFVFSLPNEYNFVQRIYYLLAIKTKTEIPWEIVEKHGHIQKPRIKDIINLFVSNGFIIKRIKFHWESRKSSRSLLFKYIDKFINLLAQIYPNLFARDVVLLCAMRN